MYGIYVAVDNKNIKGGCSHQAIAGCTNLWATWIVCCT